jgi:NAD-dependent dihydropyrimidine dehydrogenase PreA subunit
MANTAVLRHRFTGLLRDVAQAVLRLFPWPTEPGLRTVGTPGPESPVIITGNYDLTVRRVLAALSGLDAWVVVASSRGINVWCAAAGGMLSTAQVITALKTSGIEQRVSQRRALLPQLAATGVEAREVARRSGWKLRFGPVYAEDLPRYLAAGSRKDDSMRRVRFDTRERLEMACAWAGPASILLALAAAFFRPAWAIPLVVQSWAIAIMVFMVYDRLPGGEMITRRRWLLAWPLAAGLSALVAALFSAGTVAVAAAVVSATALLALLTFDFDGSTPVEGGSHFDSKDWAITLDTDLCKGVYSCWEVCPEACFEKLEDTRKVEIAHHQRCVKCGACVVQCPQDALFFTDQEGRRIDPAVIRRFKLNLLGSRGVDTGGLTSDGQDKSTPGV